MFSSFYDTANNDIGNLNTSQFPFPNTLWHVRPAKEVAIKTGLLLPIGITGLFLNYVILRILFKNKWLWSASNCLIANLAFVDFVTLFFCPWFMLVRDFYQSYVLKHFGCRFEGFFQATCLLAAVGAIMLVCYDRLAAATLTTEARITKKAAPKLIALSWFLAVALSIPFSVFRTYTERQWLDYLESFCAEDIQVLSVYWHIIITLLVWGPLGIMIVTYGVILWRLETSTRDLSSRGGGRSIVRAKGRAMRITACVLLATTVCKLPYTVLLYLWQDMIRKAQMNAVSSTFDAFWFAATYLMYLNSTLNPLIYGFTNERFRRAMDRTSGVSWCRFGAWCCVYTACKSKDRTAEKNEKNIIFTIENSPRQNRKFSRIMKNILHINRDTIEVSVHKVDEITNKQTKVTPLKAEF